MTLLTEWTHRIAYHECDVNQVVRDACYLRYMQEAAFEASAAAGYWDDRYQAMRRIWLIHETAVDYVTPLRYGDRVRIRTWVADFRRVRSRRAYELRRDADGALAAQASTDWVFLDRDTGRPAVIPDEVIAAFKPDYQPAAAQERTRFPAAPPPPPGVVTLRRPVQWRDLDSVGHVNNAAYGDFVEDAARQAASQCGWPASRMAAEGFDLATQRLRIEYRQQAQPSDEMVIATWVSELTAEGALRHTTVTRAADGELLAQAVARWRCVDVQTRTAIAAPQRFLADMRAHTALSAPTDELV
jgi:YbgC/YbaW family acyl-CoA thioester hydrolase